ncbi:hypothetical protein BgiMline_006006 [Biomphalaria glabrata]|nr:hypothetical protein BgiMline_003980 [Biomphalaria glabrata]
MSLSGLRDTIQQLRDEIAQWAHVITSLQPPLVEENVAVSLPLSSLKEFDSHEKKLSYNNVQKVYDWRIVSFWRTLHKTHGKKTIGQGYDYNTPM